ncbi:protein phosphatase 4, regulatory subunit 2 [Clonorchis sinensis]|uniref:Protein phosphatase 4, regulatory subunit 2 n=2 Tax=Clonorchis sinensis TaxID=79923 RepID=A0A8T1MIU0_CLOSI|nr:protein phosphatase 4, regulatory subunit 2 [Clonorchis sinensis]
MTLLPMENRESIICFEKDKPNNIPPVLEDYIRQIARNGQTMIPWIYIKPLLLHKFNKVVDGLLSDSGASDSMAVSPVTAELRQRVYDTLKRLDGIPFTIQRICELLENPFRHYSRPDKYLRGFEKVCMVVSTVDPHGNKMHMEDPRFPSRAGLDECGLALSDPLISPPPSPSIYDLHRRRPSRSSDEEDATDEEENEDEEDVPTEDSSHDSPNSPGAVTSLAQPPMLTAAASSSDWLLGAKVSIDPVPCKPQGHSLPSSDDTTDQISTRSVVPASTSSANPSQRTLVEIDEGKTTEASEQVGDVGAFSHTEPVATEASERPALLSPPVYSDETPVHNRSASPVETASGSPLQPGSGTSKDEWSTESPIRGLTSRKSGSGCLSVVAGEGVPPIVHILRPIGQLEAFVQNVGAEISSSPPTSLSTALSGTSDLNAPFDPMTPVSEGAILSEQEERIALPEIDAQGKLTPGVKRRATSPDSSDQFSDDPHASTSSEVEDFQKSPAKRRRLTSAVSATPEEDELHHFSGPTPLSLNGSPPIIVCNSVVANRDRDSGEQTRSVFPSPPAHEDLESDNVGDYSESNEPTVPTQSDSPTGSTVSHQTHHINSETGEEET